MAVAWDAPSDVVPTPFERGRWAIQ
ncbi:hypothetical protein FRACA_3030006 [Frankia canadensis]|uniref:Uncharacterized protein n=1 Tax=Frankia canadensis TaxID=1836972 RepID=A0A2I2KU50_9ACTN|nr:hypothetical protein FRACA_3030006 [Frankia canadensis]SOU56475.1 hypothetical protein FRACA_3030006 [Frankia canadensis]